MEAESKAIGAACRHAGRAIGFTRSTQGVESGGFAGWKEMNDYMRDNKIGCRHTADRKRGTSTKPAAEGGRRGFDRQQTESARSRQVFRAGKKSRPERRQTRKERLALARLINCQANEFARRSMPPAHELGHGDVGLPK